MKWFNDNIREMLIMVNNNIRDMLIISVTIAYCMGGTGELKRNLTKDLMVKDWNTVAYCIGGTWELNLLVV